MEEIIKELNSATEYLRAIKKIGHNKEDCDNILMHLANIEELVYKLFIANVGGDIPLSAKEILLNELNEQGHPEKVEDVIFWALEHYSKSEPKGTWGRIIAYMIKQRIIDAEKLKGK